VALSVFVGVVGVVVPDGADFELEGEAEGDWDVSSAARAGGALPTIRTIPAPRTRTSGFRADRASTAHNLPIAPLDAHPCLPRGGGYESCDHVKADQSTALMRLYRSNL
jgi:hypothetical protein